MKIFPINILFVSFITLISAIRFPVTEKSCPKGYAISSKTNTCEPIFTNGCPKKSFCLGNSSVCRCDKKTPNLNDEECTLECRKTCPGKNCLVCKSGECLCSPGYTMFNSQCQPICQDGCPNGYCFRPEICLCNNGYARSQNGTCSRLTTSADTITKNLRTQGLGGVVLRNEENFQSSERSLSNYYHRIKGVLSYLIDILNQNVKLVILTTCSIILFIVLLLSMYGILRNGTHYHLATEEYKAREPFYVYF
ncbi:fibrillin-1-like [Eupeodes corollae]|uniref:fibrillin-1-like n=1 Tax=Eupeodes corollae TaxID=290404 RepID=UPI002493178B|nr:fibrillin-1-like [Eupeodes corollae]